MENLKPSEIKSRLKDLEEGSEEWGELVLMRHELKRKFCYDKVGNCPECGSDRTPIYDGWSYVHNAKCRDCGYDAGFVF